MEIKTALIMYNYMVIIRINQPYGGDNMNCLYFLKMNYIWLLRVLYMYFRLIFDFDY